MTTTHGTAWLMVVGCLLATIATSASIAFAGEPPKPPPVPTPELTPSQVVKVVLAALKANDAADNGIRITFAFASPGNQAATGPIDKFIPLVKNGAYAPLLNHASATVREVAVQGDQAAELVTLTDAAGHKAYYLFQLGKQPADAGKLKGCWMTDGVMRVEPKNEKAA